VVARSNEAKALGIPMGVPFFQVIKLVEQHRVAPFSLAGQDPGQAGQPHSQKGDQGTDLLDPGPGGGAGAVSATVFTIGDRAHL